MSDPQTIWQWPRLSIALAVSAALVWTTFSGDLFASLLPAGRVVQVPYLRSALASASDAAVTGLLILLAARQGPAALAALVGLRGPILRPLAWIGLILGPAILVIALTCPLAKGLTPPDLIWPGFGGPFAEEVVYRGLAVGALIQLAGWRWPLACLWPALFFGVAHAAQGEDLGSVAGIVAITAAGGLLFGWLYVRWGFNLWPAVLLHVGLNSLWILFDLGENALGGWAGNAMRLAVIAGAVAATLWMAPPGRQATGA